MHKFCRNMWSLPNSSHLSSAYVRNFPDKKTPMFCCLMSQQAEVATTTTTAQTRHVNRKQISSVKKPEHISTSPASRRASLVIIAPWIRSNTTQYQICALENLPDLAIPSDTRIIWPNCAIKNKTICSARIASGEFEQATYQVIWRQTFDDKREPWTSDKKLFEQNAWTLAATLSSWKSCRAILI